MNPDNTAGLGVLIAIASITLGLLIIWPPLALIVGGTLAGVTITLVAVAAAAQNARGPEDE